MITKEYLIEKGWKREVDLVLATLTFEQKEELAKEFGRDFTGPDYSYMAVNEDGKVFFLLMRINMSNTPGRSWSIHVDNEVHSTIGCCDIETIEHFNLFMKLINCDYRL